MTLRASAASPSAVACRNAPGVSSTRARPMLIVGVARCATQLAVARQAREPMALGHCGECRSDMRLQRSRPAHVDVEARLGRRHRDVERLLERLELLRDRPCGRQRSVEPGARIGQRSIGTMWC